MKTFAENGNKAVPASAGRITGERISGILCVLLIVLFAPGPLRAAEPVHHELTVSISPSEHRLSATDVITVPGDQRKIRFLLHAGLKPSSIDPRVTVKKEGVQHGVVPLESFIVTLPAKIRTFKLRYAGAIHHPVESIGKEQTRGFDRTDGMIADEGVYLDGSSCWYPLLETEFMTFTLTVQLPARWDVVSQGSRSVHKLTKASSKVRWDSPEPQQEIYLIASRFTEYRKTSGNLSALVFLRTPDGALANKYLDATLRYIALYDRLLGPYPYAKFALVENFWETGLGMPSFTLLGPAVIRLPFIVNTSYPHEILHNWWGNSVYPVYEKGNWSEGLTAYLADHLLREQQGAGAEYRMTALQKYADYVLGNKDFPLTGFTSRHSPATEAVGYGKSLMFFHMLRLQLGDRIFVTALRDFYRTNKFHSAAFDDIEKSIDALSGRNFKSDFEQWVARTGAPQFRLSDVKTEKSGTSYVVSAQVDQVQPEEAYHLQVPVAITMEGQERAYQTVVSMNGKKLYLSLVVPSRPLRLDVDPEFDLFRRLDRDEMPPAITQVLGAKKVLVVLPSSARKELLRAYEAFARSLSGSGPDLVETTLDSELQKLPSDREVAVLGWENLFFEKTISALKGYDLSVTQKGITLGRSETSKENHAVALMARNPGNKDKALLFVASDREQALPGLARKLPHYHQYSYVVFEGDEPANVAKGRWPVVDSPLTAFLPGPDKTASPVERGKLAPREALSPSPPAYSEGRMMETVKYLSSNELKGRELGTPELDKAADSIAGKFWQAGLIPGGDEDSYFQAWKDPDRGVAMKNVIAVIPGKNPKLARESVVIGAHYDHLGLGMSLGRTEDRGAVHPGADDNASGVAALLELARVLKENIDPDRSIVFIAFTGEEEGKLGSRYYVTHEKLHPVAKCIAMVNLDTIGRLGKNKLLVLGAGSANEWVDILRGAGFVTGVDIETVAEELDSSDQMSFQEAGVPAVQLFSGPHLEYHRPTDTPDKIDPAGLVKIASVTKEVIEHLANREAPLSSTLKPGGAAQSGPKTERKTSLGTIPDFAYSGKGFRLSGVVKGSPAERAGLKEGDIITGIDATDIAGIKDLSDVLTTLKPGDTVSIIFMRAGKESITEATVSAR